VAEDPSDGLPLFHRKSYGLPPLTVVSTAELEPPRGGILISIKRNEFLDSIDGYRRTGDGQYQKGKANQETWDGVWLSSSVIHSANDWSNKNFHSHLKELI
jgi:hypothetical protein